jgi:hypothetical protein
MLVTRMDVAFGLFQLVIKRICSVRLWDYLQKYMLIFKSD